MKKLIDLPPDIIKKLERKAKKRRTKVKPLIEGLAIEYANGRITDSEGEILK